ncbi:homogentisate 1,2-dioxygenase [Sphingomonas sp. Leaf10]|uniref:homogentisate 1,2-dioxygenase n=1 Tax=Sphingomonas sp. Leaf10 TaxID=1735676 RepID=UPI000AD19A13|nr:homogentisate 1,2-dioxygenase [Sphingomonas sp. Leaf10]
MIDLLLAALLSQAAPAACTTVAPPPAELAGWNDRDKVTAGADGGRATLLTPGTAVTGTLLPTADLRHVATPEKAGPVDSRGGLFAFTVATPGRYRVALGSAAWIDILTDGKPVASIGHSHGPACSGIRKMVDFQLGRGRHLVQIAGSRDRAVALMVARLPDPPL